MRELNSVSQFPDLSWRWYNDVPILKGNYQFKTVYRGEPFQDNFNLEFHFPPNYPDNIPIVKELDYKIPITFHKFTDNSLCLGTPSEQCLIFSEEPTIDNFIKNLVNPYLLSWLWYKRFNEMPWGEYEHGAIGLLKSYQKLFKLTNPKNIIYFLKRIVFDNLSRMDDCPCGSGIPFKKCHYKIVINFINKLSKEHLMHDYKFIFEEIFLSKKLF